MNEYSSGGNANLMKQSMDGSAGNRNGKSVSTLTSTTNNIYKNFENYENKRRLNFQDVNYKLLSNSTK